MKRLDFVLGLGLGLACWLAPAVSSACSCGEYPLIDQAHDANAIFEGVVERSVVVADGDLSYTRHEVRALRVWKGDIELGEIVLLLGPAEANSCSAPEPDGYMGIWFGFNSEVEPDAVSYGACMSNVSSEGGEVVAFMLDAILEQEGGMIGGEPPFVDPVGGGSGAERGCSVVGGDAPSRHPVGAVLVLVAGLVRRRRRRE